MNTLFIPIGIDCGVADFLKNCNLRVCSLPFDWTVTYNGITDIVNNNFYNYLPKKNNPTVRGPCGETNLFNSLSSTYFMHNKFPEDYDKMNRRISRFLELLQKKDKELIFIRRGHAIHHHKESELFKCEIKNEIDDCELLYALLKKKYTHLKFKIILFLECDKCFHQHHSDNIEIYNIVKGYNRDFFYIRLKNVLQKILNK